MYNLKEDDFIDIWKSKVNPEKVDEIINEEKDSNQLELFNEKEIIG